MIFCSEHFRKISRRPNEIEPYAYGLIMTLLLCYVFSGLGITAGAHRLWSHRTYKARLPLRLFLIIANSMAFQNDVYEWARDHRVHHKFTKTHADPHNSRRGFFFSHVGWVLVRKHPAVQEKSDLLDLSDLKAEKLVMFQRRYYKPCFLLMCFILPTLVPWYCWGETFQHSLYVAAFLRYIILLNMILLLNSVAHLYGYRPYDKNIDACETVLLSLATLAYIDLPLPVQVATHDPPPFQFDTYSTNE
ncbi:acyl-CoA desaturase 1-like [Dipodomys merriami]|uniref:acyl-CoA desaturase 1-like n=1 Tax=Dipodomys merriami TaxID=94247 RepID=UPI00384D2FC5